MNVWIGGMSLNGKVNKGKQYTSQRGLLKEAFLKKSSLLKRSTERCYHFEKLPLQSKTLEEVPEEI